MRGWLPCIDLNQGAQAAYGVIVGVAISFALSAIWRPSYKLLPVLALIILISLAWRTRTCWPDTITAIRPFELGGALGLMFIANLLALYGLIPLLCLVCIVPRNAANPSSP